MREPRKFQKNKNSRRKFLAIFVVLIVTFLAVFFYPNFYYSAHLDQINTTRQILTDLEMDNIDTQRLNTSNPFSIVDKYQVLFFTVKQVRSLPDLQNQKQKIIDNFDAEVTSFRDQILTNSKISEIYTFPNLEEVDFQVKKDSEKFILNLKIELEEKITNHNLSVSGSSQLIRYSFDPEIHLSKMTLEEKVGQLFGFAIKGNYLSETERIFLEQNHIGGVALFGNNVSSEAQLQQLTGSIQLASPKVPVLIATDQEGGVVTRLWWDTTGSPRTLAALEDTLECEAWKARSSTLQASGINWNLGTIGDVSKDPGSFIYQRTFSDDYQKAAVSVKIASECEQVVSTLKHWPGHGATTVDTHMQLGVLSVGDEQTWLQTDNIPFQAGIDAKVDTIMVGHLLMNWLNPEIPATLSKSAIDYLRNTLKYEGLIVTDDMMMLTNSGYTIDEAVKQAILAGNDFIWVVNDTPEDQQRLIDMTKAMVTTGELSEEELDQRVLRILETKVKLPISN